MENPSTFQRDTIQADIRAEYRRYGIVTRNPDAPGKPCWNIGLLTIISTPETVPLFASLYREYDIEGMVGYVPIREACKSTGGPGRGENRGPPKYNPKDDWWNYDAWEQTPDDQKA